jgi:hypothetical protein
VRSPDDTGPGRSSLATCSRPLHRMEAR